MKKTDKAMKSFIRYLKMNNMRITGERKKIASEIFRINDHFDVDTLAAKLRRKNISRATVYRTVAVMEKGGLLRKPLHQHGRALYEHVYRWEPHGHLVCAECGTVQSFHEGVIKDLQTRICPKFDFVPLSFHISIRGWCKTCTHKNRNKKK